MFAGAKFFLPLQSELLFLLFIVIIILINFNEFILLTNKIINRVVDITGAIESLKKPARSSAGANITRLRSSTLIPTLPTMGPRDRNSISS